MADSKPQSAELVPSWDGNPRGWRRYQREVSWYVLGTKKSQRALIGPRLVSKLTGPARLLAMSWSRADIAGPQGVQVMLRKLEQSPLVRKKLPNTAAVMQQYFNYRRNPGESISSYLVRETLFYEEFIEALQDLHDGGAGAFLLDDILGEGEDEDDDDGETSHGGSTKSKKSGKSGYSQVPQADPDEPGDGPGDDRPRAGQPGKTTSSTLSSTDSFILKTLRGWRLLSGAALNGEEWRSILASTNNQLNYDAVSSALNILFDEQMQHPRAHHSGQGLHHNLHTVEEDSEWNWQDDPWDWSDSWANMAWENSDWHPVDDDQGEDDGAGASDQPPSEGSQDAMAADRSWSQAQRTSQQIRKDRGFGQSSNPSSTGCFVCGGNHRARDCPDKNAPSNKGKGYGKHMHYTMDEPYDNFAFYKGKLKGKPGAKMAYMFEEFYNYYVGKGKGKSQNKGKLQSKNRNHVNSYYQEVYDFHGLQIDREPNEVSMDAAKVEQENLGHLGMLDCGATCSAGPQSSIQRLLTAVLDVDRSASVRIDGKRRPRFRFGSGSWGRALHHVTITSSITQRTFEAYTLPDPPESQEDWFNPSMLVPVLVGMDFISGNGLVMDFKDGFAVCAAFQDSQPFYMPQNAKQHYMVDIVDFLCCGQTSKEGHPSIHIIQSEEPQEKLPPKRVHWVENYMIQPVGESVASSVGDVFTMESERDCMVVSSTAIVESDHRHFHRLWKRRRELNGFPQQQQRLMGNLITPWLSNSTNGTQEGGARDGHGATDASRWPRSSNSTDDVALLQQARGREGSGEQVREVAQLHRVRPEDALHPLQGCALQQHLYDQSGQHDKGPQGAQGDDARRSKAQRGAGQGHSRQGDCRRTTSSSLGQLQARPQEEPGEDHQSQGEGDPNFDNTEFRRLCRGGAPIVKSVTEQLDGASSCRTHCGDQSDGLPHRGRAAAGDGAGGGKNGITDNCFSSACAGRCGAGTCLRRAQLGLNEIENEENRKKVPLPVGHKMMEMIHSINSDLQNHMVDTIYDGKPLVWEMFCQKESELSNACLKQGIPVQRINLHSGFDLYKDETYERLWTLFKHQRPKKLWISTMCTLWCDWVDLNYHDRREVLEKRRRGERQMFKKLVRFLKAVVEFDPTVELFWEWPHRCRGWKERIIEDFFNKLDQYYDCRINGCRFGLKSAKGNFIKKAWRIRTTSVSFHAEFRLRVCLGNHTHEWLHGVETSRSAYYPPQMCASIARHWRQQLLPDRWWRLLWSTELVEDPGVKSLHAAEVEPPAEVDGTPDDDKSIEPEPSILEDDPEAPQPSAQELEKWKAQLHRLHRAAGHPSKRNLVRMTQDAQLPEWKIRAAKDFSCPICQELQPGGLSSKQIPPSSMHPLPAAWEQIGVDIAEWTVPTQDLKVKFILFIDLATKFRVTETLFTYKHGEYQTETADQVIRALMLRWLVDKPRPRYVVFDNANTMTSAKTVEILADVGIQPYFPPEGESWAHGITERGIGQVKETASLLQQSLPDQDPVLTLAMATCALNNTEFTKGFTSIQWAYGQQNQVGDDDLRQQLSLPVDRLQNEFVRLMAQRELAEECARKSRAKVALSKLKNSSIRQPLRTFSMAQPVFIWRKFLPHTIYAGRKGGHRHTAKPRWVGPGRVVFHELTPGQHAEDRKHVLWVILGNRICAAPFRAWERDLWSARRWVACLEAAQRHDPQAWVHRHHRWGAYRG